VRSGLANHIVQVKDKPTPTKDALQWKFKGATAAIVPADFGDPVNGSPTYQLCVYDAVGGSPQLAIEATIAGGGTCGTKPCWKDLEGKGFQYKNKTTNTDGIAKVLLKAGAAGKGQIQVKGKGVNLELPGPVGAAYFAQDHHRARAAAPESGRELLGEHVPARRDQEERRRPVQGSGEIVARRARSARR
jgi:hypothetical protein